MFMSAAVGTIFNPLRTGVSLKFCILQNNLDRLSYTSLVLEKNGFKQVFLASNEDTIPSTS